MTTEQGQNQPGPGHAAQPARGQHGWAQQAPVQPGPAPWPGAPGPMGESPGVVAAAPQQPRAVGAAWPGPQAQGVAAAQQGPGTVAAAAGWPGPQAQGVPAAPTWSGPQGQEPPVQQVPGAGPVAHGRPGPQAAGAPAQQLPGTGTVAPGWSQGVAAQQLPGAGTVAPGWSEAQGAAAVQQVPGAGTVAPGWPEAQGAAAAQQLPGAGSGSAAGGWSGPHAGVAQLPGAGTAAPARPGPQAHAPQAGPPPVAGPPDASSGGPYAAASRRTPFPTLVLVELRKLTGTVSDRILLAFAPVVLVGVTVLIHTASDYASTFASAQGQISPTFYTVRVGHVLLHAVLIKLIAGEWQHRSAQPTLLVQPSRARYFLAQATVVLMLWAVAAGLQLVTTLLVAPAAINGVGAGYLLGYRIGWVVGVCVLGSLLTILVALTVAMLVPNAAGALAIYFATVPIMFTVSGLAPEVFAWVDPSSATAALATVASVEGPGPVIVSLVLWAGLLALAGFRVARRDLA